MVLHAYAKLKPALAWPFAGWWMAGHGVNHNGQVIGSGADTLRKESVDLSTQQQNDGKVVEEEQQDNCEACYPCIAHRMRNELYNSSEVALERSSLRSWLLH